MIYYYLLKDVYYENIFENISSQNQNISKKLYIRIILQTEIEDLLNDNELSNYIPGNKEVIVITKNTNEQNEIFTVRIGDGIHSIQNLPNVNWYEYNVYTEEERIGLNINQKTLEITE